MLFSLCIYEDGGWFRTKAGKGYTWTIAHPSFSERYGYSKPVFKFMKFRVFRLEVDVLSPLA